jgi:acetylornithine deacetylase/succinyl-diaminopimelate desuccinylase-like protein
LKKKTTPTKGRRAASRKTAATTAGAAAPGFDLKSLRAHADERRGEFESILKEWVEIPSVSMDPERKDDMRRMADAASATLRAFGFDAKILKTSGQPLVFGSRKVADDAPNVTIYNHIDVQPGGPKEEWKTDPFVFTKQGDVYYGRGTTDDKGPALSALFGARRALELGARVNVNFLWELEEEIGSPSFEGGIKAAKADLKTDFVLVSDTIWISRKRPAAPAGLRGLQCFRITLETGIADRHSGLTGGAARNPITELCDLIGKIVDGKTGDVKIPGFYKDWKKPTKRELADFKASGFTVKNFMDAHGFKSLRSKDPVDVMTRIWAKPTFEVHGIAGGYQGPGVKTAVPPRAEAKVSMRLVPRMDPKKTLDLTRAFIKKHLPDAVVHPESGLKPYEGTTDGPLADLVRSSMAFAFGKPPVFVREGGSIGAVKTMEDVLSAPVIFLGLSLPEHGYHAPNENYDWAQARGGVAAFAKFFHDAASLPKDAAKAALAAKKRR